MGCPMVKALGKTPSSCLIMMDTLQMASKKVLVSNKNNGLLIRMVTTNKANGRKTSFTGTGDYLFLIELARPNSSTLVSSIVEFTMAEESWHGMMELSTKETSNMAGSTGKVTTRWT